MRMTIDKDQHWNVDDHDKCAWIDMSIPYKYVKAYRSQQTSRSQPRVKRRSSLCFAMNPQRRTCSNWDHEKTKWLRFFRSRKFTRKCALSESHYDGRWFVVIFQDQEELGKSMTRFKYKYFNVKTRMRLQLADDVYRDLVWFFKRKW